MDGAREQLLARSGLAEDQHRRIGGGHFLYLSERTEQSLALADNFVRAK